MQTDTSKAPINNLYGIGFMLLHAAMIPLIYAAAKYFTKEYGFNSSQVVFFYKFAILLCIIPWIFKDGLRSIYTKRFKLHVLRGSLSIGGSLSFMYALQHVSMVNATALGYMEQVALVIIGIFYFKEALTKSKIFAVVVSLIGAIIIVYPTIIQFNNNLTPVFFQKYSDNNEQIHYYAFVLLSIIFWASNCIVVKQLGKTEKNKTQLFYVMLFSSIFAFPVAFCKWTRLENFTDLNISVPTAFIDFDVMQFGVIHIGFISLLALCYFLHSIAIFNAYKYSEMSTVVPFEYTRLIFTGVLGFMIFGEKPIPESYVGYALIIGAGVLLVRSEALRKKHDKIRKEKLDRINTDIDEDFHA